jgi:hypothetical protein
MESLASETDKAQLQDIGFHWGEAYVVGRSGEVYTAHRIGYPEHVIRAESAAELRHGIRSDYFAWMAGLRERMFT